MANKQAVLDAGDTLSEQLDRLVRNGNYKVAQRNAFGDLLVVYAATLQGFLLRPIDDEESPTYDGPLATTNSAIELRNQVRPDDQNSQNRYIAACNASNLAVKSVTKP